MYPNDDTRTQCVTSFEQQQSTNDSDFDWETIYAINPCHRIKWFLIHTIGENKIIILIMTNISPSICYNDYYYYYHYNSNALTYDTHDDTQINSIIKLQFRILSIRVLSLWMNSILRNGNIMEMSSSYVMGGALFYGYISKWLWYLFHLCIFTRVLVCLLIRCCVDL